MKPFDLSLAKAGHPIADRSGNPVTFIAHVPDAVPNSRVVVLTSLGFVSAHFEDGRTYAKADTCNDDLFMVVPTVKRSGWGWLSAASRAEAVNTSESAAHRKAEENGGVACFVEWEEEVK